MTKSLIHAVRERYLSSIRSVQPPSRWKVLVVDSFTQALLNSVLKLNDILQQNVSTIENIERGRQPQPTFEACYLLTPTSANVDRIIRDLSPQPQGRSPQYAAGHIFFVDGLSEQLLHKLTSSPAEPQLRQLIELFSNFWPSEAQAFSLKSPRSFFSLFQPIGGAYGLDQSEALAAIEDELTFSTQALLNVCVTLNEFPQIRYYNPQHPALGALAPVGPNQGASNSAYGGSARLARLGGGSNASSPTAVNGEHFTKRLALRLQQALDSYVQDNQPTPDPGRPKGVLFITDRSMDTAAPLLHEFSYQAMANDLLPIEEGTRYHYCFQNAEGHSEEKDAVLSDEDAVWTGIRHLHIAEAIDRLSRDFQAHAGEAGAYSNNASSLNDMRDMLASLPHMQETKDKLSLHLTMAQDCMARFEKTRIPQQAMVEQNCATRLTPEGQKPRTLVEEMVPLLDDRSVSNADKVRIIALYIMYCEGVNDEDRKRLFQHARLGLHEMDAVNNLVHLGAQVVKDPSQSSAWDGWFRKGKRRQQPGENEYELSRYQPLVKLMIEDHFAGKLEQSTYPYVRDAPPEVAGGGPSSYLPAGLASASGGRDSPLSRVAGGFGGGSSSSNSAARPSGAPSSLRSAKPTWHQKGRAGGGAGGGGAGGAMSGSGSGGYGSSNGTTSIRDETRQRVIVFVAGGMTYSEMRSVYQISQKMNKDGYIGSSHVFTPETFINALKTFGKAGNTYGGGRSSVGSVGGSLPVGASALSPPSNEVSGLRVRAKQAIHGVGNGNGNGSAHPAGPPSPSSRQQRTHPQEASPHSSSYDQGLYDRRFGSTAPSQSSLSSNHSQQQRAQAAPQMVHAHTFSPATGAPHLAQQRQQSARPGAVGSGAHSFDGANAGLAKPPASLGNAGGSTMTGADKEKKKKMKNPFAFKRS
ncbi:unnamed protein product [Parajaminaea phylloscopi]